VVVREREKGHGEERLAPAQDERAEPREAARLATPSATAGSRTAVALSPKRLQLAWARSV